jgi:hypothetical protein
MQVNTSLAHSACFLVEAVLEVIPAVTNACTEGNRSAGSTRLPNRVAISLFFNQILSNIKLVNKRESKVIDVALYDVRDHCLMSVTIV